MSYSGGEEYRGEFLAGERHGRGLYRYAANDTYDGEWRNGQRHGEGTYRSEDGRCKKNSLNMVCVADAREARTLASG